MYIEIDSKQIDVLLAALECWERDPARGGLFGAMLGAMLGPKEGDPGYDKYKTQMARQDELDKADERQRKLTALRLKMLLTEAQMQPSEFQRPPI